mgnify:CR=1 FL=1
MRGFAGMGYRLARERFALRTDDLIAYHALVLAGAGVGFLPHYMARHHTELVPLLAQFNELLGRLDLAYQQLEGFNADVSHELRTPLATLLASNELALRHPRMFPVVYWLLRYVAPVGVLIVFVTELLK